SPTSPGGSGQVAAIAEYLVVQRVKPPIALLSASACPSLSRRHGMPVLRSVSKIHIFLLMVSPLTATFGPGPDAPQPGPPDPSPTNAPVPRGSRAAPPRRRWPAGHRPGAAPARPARRGGRRPAGASTRPSGTTSTG